MIEELKKIAGPKGWTEDTATYLKEARGLYEGKSPLVLLPDSTEKVSEIVTYCHDHKISLVPQGGNTGLVGGGIPDQSNSQIVLSLKRLNKLRDFDRDNHTLCVEGGMILADLQKIAADTNCLFPVSLASEGSCQVGGAISTNAGGINVLHFGSMRDQVLGLEVVLADGRIWNGLKALRKDNTGYDLKQLFMGAEGTLGIITAATLKVYPAFKQTQTAFVAVSDPTAALDLLTLARDISGDTLVAFELIPRIGLTFVTRHMPPCRDPLDTAHPWYVLLECATSLTPDLLDLKQLLMAIFDKADVIDGVIAKNERENAELWALRENLSEAQKFEGGSIKFDIAVPVSKVPAFLEIALSIVKKQIPDIRPVPFGHMGDGNLHFNLSQPLDMDKQDFLDQWPALNLLIHDIVNDFEGSISAEHGIGVMKVKELIRYKSDIHMDLLYALKNTLDPHNIMNPNKVIGKTDVC